MSAKRVETKPTVPAQHAEAALAEWLEATWARLRPHLFMIAWVVCGLIILVAVVAAVNSSRRAKIANGLAALDEAETTERLSELVAEYENTVVGESALLRLAQKMLEEGRYSEAATRFSLFVQDYPDSEHVLRARLGEAYALEGDGKLSQAEKLFSAVGSGAEAPRAAAEAFVGAGRCAEAQGKLAQARKWYESAVAASAEGQYRERAMNALQRLETAAQAEPAAADSEAASGGAEAAPAAPQESTSAPAQEPQQAQ